MERMKSSPFYDNLFAIYGGCFSNNRVHCQKLHGKIKSGMWVTVVNDCCCAITSNVIAVYYSEMFHEYRISIEQYRDKTHTYEDVIEYFDKDTFNVIHPFRFPDVPETKRISKDIFMGSFHKFMEENKYLNDVAFLGLKTLYVNLGKDNKLDCTEHMEKALDRFDSIKGMDI